MPAFDVLAVSSTPQLSPASSTQPAPELPAVPTLEFDPQPIRQQTFLRGWLHGRECPGSGISGHERPLLQQAGQAPGIEDIHSSFIYLTVGEDEQ